MTLPKFEYFAPKTLSRAIALQKEDGKFLAGGTDLLVAMKKKIQRPGRMIDLNGIAALKSVRRAQTNQIRIGALNTLSQLQDNALVRQYFPALSAVIADVGAWQLRNLGTLGGNLCLDTRCYYYNQSVFLKKRFVPCLKAGGDVCHVVKGKDTCYAVYSGDMAATLVSLGAGVKIAGPGYDNEMALAGLFSGSGIKPNILKFNEILTHVTLPIPPAGSGFSYRKLRLRDTIDFPLLGVAVFLRLEPGSGVCRDLRLVLGAIAPAPIVVAEAAEMVRNRKITPALMEEVGQIAREKAHPVANTAATPRYRRRMVPELVKEAIREALSRTI
ncbi:MAG: FAD binding domain-containing protein [Desulfobacterales bacterium]|nr:FAD binding domain-containing protein [Desulfobacterales bacterium]